MAKVTMRYTILTIHFFYQRQTSPVDEDADPDYDSDPGAPGNGERPGVWNSGNGITEQGHKNSARIQHAGEYNEDGGDGIFSG